MNRNAIGIGAFACALAATVAPLWAAHYLPFVDLPQHLHLINVLGHLQDPNTLYPEVFKARGGITPYLGYYDTVWLFARVMDVFHANALFLTLVAIATPLSVGALAKQLGGSFWIGILACPLFYGDNLYWGFINYCASLPLILLSLALFIAVLEGEPSPLFGKEIALALLLIAVQLTHVQAFAYAAVALPILLVLRPSNRQRRERAIVAVTPAVALFTVWSLGKLGEQPDIAPGEPWKAWGPLLSSQNLSFNPWQANLGQLGTLLANGFSDNADHAVIPALVVVAVAVLVLGIVFRDRETKEIRLLARGPILAALALAMFVFMPFDVRGYMYYVNYRFAELFALILIAALPFPRVRWAEQGVMVAAAALSVWYGALVMSHFQKFEAEAAPMNQIISAAGERPKIMALSYDTGSAIMTHPVYLHFASYAALARGGMTSFSFAATAHSPLQYQGAPPPAPPSEWRADLFDYARYGSYYNYYLVRGRVSKMAVFHGQHPEIDTADQSGPFALYARKSE